MFSKGMSSFSVLMAMIKNIGVKRVKLVCVFVIGTCKITNDFGYPRPLVLHHVFWKPLL